MAAHEAAAPPDVAAEPAEVAAGPADGTPAGVGVGATATGLNSPLEKPLCELTEEDIAQVTREDCRRFLKGKGMRRPSWNKSQAIQQVISLKALLEDRNDADDDTPSTTGSISAASIPAFFPRRPPDPEFPATVPQVSIPRPLGSPPPRPAELQIAVAGSSLSPCQRRDPPVPAFPAADACYRFPIAGGATILQPGTASLAPRATGADGEDLAGQLTIFYDGRLSVYDGVSPEKARVIMQIAASPSCYDLPPLSPLPSRPLQCHELAQPPPPLIPGLPLQCHDLAQAQAPPSPVAGGGGCFRPPLAPTPALASPSAPPVVFSQILQSSGTGRFPQHFRESMEEWRVPREVEPECPTSRAASLQRYLEKRKDRLKCKKYVVGSSSGMEMYLGQKMRDQMPNGQLSCSEMRSPPQAPRPPQTPTRCNSIENPAQNLSISIDLNDDDIQEG